MKECTIIFINLVSELINVQENDVAKRNCEKKSLANTNCKQTITPPFYLTSREYCLYVFAF